MLLDNWVLKAASLTLAFVLWFVVITEEDPVDTKTFYGVKVSLINTEKLKELGRVYEVLDGTDTIRSVTVEAPGSVLDKLEADDIVAEADLNNISGMDTVEIKFSSPGYTRDIIGIKGNISNVKLSIEEKSSKFLNIKYNLIGDVAEGCMISKNGVSLEHSRLEVEGPKSKIDRIANAVVDVDVTGAGSDFATPLAVYLVDKEGNKLNFESVNQSVKIVNVNAEVLKIKTIPVEYVIVGEVAEGYLLTGVVEGSPATVEIAGKPELLNRVSGITVDLDVTGATENLVKTIDLEAENEIRSGIIFADEEFDGNAYVTVYVEEEAEKNLTLRTNNVQIINVPAELIAEVVIEQNMPALQVKGLDADISSLRESTLKGIVDVAEWMEQQQLTDLDPGIYNIPVQFELSEGQTAVNEVSVQILFAEYEEEVNE